MDLERIGPTIYSSSDTVMIVGVAGHWYDRVC